MTSSYAVYDDGVLRITSTANPPGLAISGEIDESTYPGLLSALERGADGRAEMHFSLGGLKYCDLAGLRAIVCATGADGGGPGLDRRHGERRAVVLHEIPPQLMTVLRIVGWDTTPGLVLDTQASGAEPRSVGNMHGSAVV
ncbi:MAG TPA: STAS domain-containing protein [Streptosporangiaceae bacterium]|nr:STAS domain-containing protein [Streptosporangiaceae bacterium]